MSSPRATTSLPASRPHSEAADGHPGTLRRPLSTPLQRVRGVLAGDRSLALLLPQARRLAELNRLFARAAPYGLARACRVAAVTGETALVYCSYGAAAARVRSQAKTLARALSAAGQTVSEIKVKVRADWAVPDRPAKQGMGKSALDAWHALDRALPPGDLKDAVKRLLEHQLGAGR